MPRKSITFAIIFVFLFFNFNKSIVISAGDADLPILHIICPSKVNESYEFSVTIKSDNQNLKNVSVFFNEEEKITNDLGMTRFTAPRINYANKSTFTIYASKDGYNSTTKEINVTDIPQIFLGVESSGIFENTTFNVDIIDEEGKSIENVSIFFNRKSYISDQNGTIELKAPDVNKSKVFYINASRHGYINNSILIIVSPQASDQNILGLYIGIISFLFIAIAPIIILIIRYFRKKKINRLN